MLFKIQGFQKSFLNVNRDKLLKLTKCFLKISNQDHVIIMIILMFGFIHFFSDHMIIHGSSNGMIRFKMIFQIGFKNSGYFLVLFNKSFVLKSDLPMITSKNMLGVCSQFFALKPPFLCLDFQFHGSCVGTLFKYSMFRKPFSHVFGKGIQSQMVVKLCSFHHSTTLLHKKIGLLLNPS